LGRDRTRQMLIFDQTRAALAERKLATRADIFG
jgi:hypothetical protein